MSDAPGPVLAVRALRRFDGFTLDIAFESSHTRTAIAGPSGGGKTQTLRAIAGLLPLDDGRIFVGGRVVYDRAAGVNVPAHRRRVGYVPQGYALFPHLDVANNVLFGVSWRDPSRNRLLGELLDLVGLRGLEHRRVSDLSGGQKQRVAIARALAARPSVLLLDEPLSALDSELRRTLREDLLALQERAGVPMLVVTHDVLEAFAMCDTMVVISNGRVLQYGPRDEVFERPQTVEVAKLVGFRNALAARVVSLREGWCEIAWAGGVLRVEGEPFPVGSEVVACIRPGRVMVRRLEDSDPRPNLLAGRISEEFPTVDGRCLRFLVGGDRGAAIEIEMSEYAYYRLGLNRRKAVEVSIAPSAIWLVRP